MLFWFKPVKNFKTYNKIREVTNREAALYINKYTNNIRHKRTYSSFYPLCIAINSFSHVRYESNLKHNNKLKDKPLSILSFMSLFCA